MINASTAYRTLLKGDSKPWVLKVEIDLIDTANTELAVSQGSLNVSQGTLQVKPYKQTITVTNDQLWKGGLSFDDAVSNDGVLDIGSAIINSFSFVLDNYNDEFEQYDFTDAVVKPYIGLKLPSGTTEYVRKGVYIVDDTSYNGATIRITSLDRMSLLDKPYTTSLNYPATLSTILTDVCSKCGVTLAAGSSNFPHRDFIVLNKPSSESTTYREVLASLAQIAGVNARFNYQGYLELKWYDTSTIASGSTMETTVKESGNKACFVDVTGLSTSSTFVYCSTFSHQVCVDNTVVTGVRVAYHDEETTGDNADGFVLTGYEGLIVSVENNLLIQNETDANQIAGWLGSSLVGLSYRVLSAAHLPDPTIEAGDVGYLVDRKGQVFPCLVSGTSFKPGATQNTRSSGETPVKNSAARFTSMTRNYVNLKEMIETTKDYYEAGLEELDKAMAEKSGLYTTEETLEDGSTIFYMHDMPTLEESKVVWKMNAEAWAVSTDGGKTWNGGMTVNGDVIARYLSADGVNANWINAGVIRDRTNTNYWNLETGEFSLVGVPSDNDLQEIRDAMEEMESDLQSQIDGKIDTWYQSSDPSSAWTTTDLKNSHKGDLWYKTSDSTTWRWSGTKWEEQDVPEDVFDAIDGKSTIFYGQPSGTYSGVQAGDYLVDASSGNTYRWNGSSWAKQTDYSTAITNAISSLRNDLEEQIDGKIDTWYQSADPSTSWTTTDVKNSHKGDLWYRTSDSTTWRWSGTAWQEQEVADSVFDAIDGKSTIFYGAPTGTYTGVETGDFLVDPSTGTSYRWTGSTWVAVQDYQTALNSVYGIYDAVKSGTDPITYTAQVLKNGKDVTKEYPSSWYSWYKTNGTNNTETFLAYGYSISVDPDDFQYGGMLVGYFTIYSSHNLVVSSNNLAVSQGEIILAIP